MGITISTTGWFDRTESGFLLEFFGAHTSERNGHLPTSVGTISVIAVDNYVLNGGPVPSTTVSSTGVFTVGWLA
jgi:hypothetical protein